MNICFMKKFILLLLSVFWLSACSDYANEETSFADETEDTPLTLNFSENDVIKGRMRIKLKEEPSGQVAVRSVGGQVSTGIRALDESATVLGITRMERTFPYAGKYEERTRREGLHLWYDVWYSEEVATTRAVSEVTVLKGVETVCPIPKIKLNGILAASPLVESLMQASPRGIEQPWNDPLFNKQWNLYNPGTESWQAKGADIRLSDVWKQYNGDPSIIVAIVDGGIVLDNPDLLENIWINPGETPGNGIDDDHNGYIDDIYGYNFVNNTPTITGHRHGTHVSGIIGATTNNNVGISGIAGGDGSPNSGVKLMSCQIFAHPNWSDALNNNLVATDTPAAIKYAADNGAVICQNSWGYTGTISVADKKAIDYFIKYAGCDNNGNQLPDSPMKGGIVLFATNNKNNSDPSNATPADYEKVIGVAAIGPTFKKGTYSNYGDYIDICAPGGEYNGGEVYSTTTQNRGYYEYLLGASMACPHASGVAALVIEKYGVGKQGFTADQLTEILLKSAYDVDIYNPKYAGKLGSGCVNAAGALQAELPSDKPLMLNTSTVTNGSISFRVNSQLAGNAVVNIYNGTGNRVFRKSVRTIRYTTLSLDISKLASGYYTLEYECNGSKVKEKFVKY